MTDARDVARWIDAAERAALDAADTLRGHFGRARGAVDLKGAVDLVTDADRASEGLLRARLESETGLGVLGEEDGMSGRGDGAIWVVDPLDGTTNFAHRVPHFAVSVGLWSGTRALGGVIVDPMRREVFRADLDGLRWNDAPLAPPRDDPPADAALVATGFPYDRRTAVDNNIRAYEAVMRVTRDVRRMGAAALDLAWVAIGRYDAFWEPRLKPWDVVAGIAL